MTTETKEIKKTEIKPEILAMSETIQKGLAIDKKAGAITPADSIFASTLPADVTMELCEKVNDHYNVFTPAVMHAFGKASFEVLKAHKGMEKVEISINTVNKDKIKLVTDRAYISHPVGDATKEIHTYNKVSVVHEMRSGKSGSQVKAIRAEMSELAMKALSK